MPVHDMVPESAIEVHDTDVEVNAPQVIEPGAHEIVPAESREPQVTAPKKNPVVAVIDPPTTLPPNVMTGLG
jgi:hypothetical protein